MTEDELLQLPAEERALKRQKIAQSISIRFNQLTEDLDEHDEKLTRIAASELCLQLHHGAKQVLPFGLEGFKVLCKDWADVAAYNPFLWRWLITAMDDGPDGVCGVQHASRNAFFDYTYELILSFTFVHFTLHTHML